MLDRNSKDGKDEKYGKDGNYAKDERGEFSLFTLNFVRLNFVNQILHIGWASLKEKISLILS